MINTSPTISWHLLKWMLLHSMGEVFITNPPLKKQHNDDAIYSLCITYLSQMCHPYVHSLQFLALLSHYSFGKCLHTHLHILCTVYKGHCCSCMLLSDDSKQISHHSNPCHVSGAESKGDLSLVTRKVGEGAELF